MALLLAGLLAVAFAVLPASDAHTANTTEPDWGRPRDPDTILFDYRLPDLAGWQQKFSGAWASEIVADKQCLYVVSGQGLGAYALDDGKLKWLCPEVQQARFIQDFCEYDGEILLLHDGQGLVAVEKAAGILRWRREGLAPLAASWEWVWATKTSEYPGWGEDVLGKNLLLLHTDDGSTKAELSYYSVSTASAKLTVPGMGWPDPNDTAVTTVYVMADGAVRACKASGEQWHWDCGGPERRVLLHSDANGLLVEEYLDYGLCSDRVDAETGPDASEADRDLAWKRLGPPLRVNKLDYQSGKPRWQNEPDLGSSQGLFGNCVLSEGGAWFVVRRPVWVTDKDAGWSTSSHALDLYDGANGEFLRTLLAADADAIPRQYFWERYSQVLTVMVEDDLGFNQPRRQTLRQFDLLSGESHSIELPIELRIGSLAVSEGYVAATGDVSPGFGQYGQGLDALVLYRVAAYGLIAGTPQRSGFPAYDTALAERFTASPEPLADSDLMRALVAGGRSSIVQLYGLYGSLSPAQRQALLELCLYVQQRSRNGDAGTYLQPLDELIAKVLDRHSAALSVEEVRKMLADPRLARHKQEFVGLLALLGGAEAATLLEEIYAGLDRQEISPPQPPYTHRTDSWQLDRQSRPWSIDSPAGGRMTAFVDSALTGSVVWIGDDQDNDGSYEAVWPTPFNDVFNRYFLPHGMEGLEAPLGPLGLQLLGDELLVTHHQPTMEHEQREDYYIDSMTGATQVQDRITLEDLRRDSDGDGLSDQTERRMFTDPQSADSDQDGLPDRSDAAPNVDPTNMGRQERGVCRAMHFARRLDPWADTEPLATDGWGMPVRASYILTEGCGPVLFRDPRAYCICLSRTDQQQGYRDMHSFAFPVDTNVNVVTIDAAGRRSDADAAGPGQPYQYTGEYVVNIDYYGSGTEVELKDVDGELYPTNICGGWIG